MTQPVTTTTIGVKRNRNSTPCKYTQMLKHLGIDAISVKLLGSGCSTTALLIKRSVTKDSPHPKITSCAAKLFTFSLPTEKDLERIEAQGKILKQDPHNEAKQISYDKLVNRYNALLDNYQYSLTLYRQEVAMYKLLSEKNIPNIPVYITSALINRVSAVILASFNHYDFMTAYVDKPLPFKYPGIPLLHVSCLASKFFKTLKALQKEKIVHYDLTHLNFSYNYFNQELNIFDWALSLTPNTTNQHILGRNLTFMAPSLLLGDPPSAHTDRWSIGPILFSAFSGGALFCGACRNKKKRLEEIIRKIGLPPLRFLSEWQKHLHKTLPLDLFTQLYTYDKPSKKWVPRTQEKIPHYIRDRINPIAKERKLPESLANSFTDLVERLTAWFPLPLTQALDHPFTKHHLRATQKLSNDERKSSS